MKNKKKKINGKTKLILIIVTSIMLLSSFLIYNSYMTIRLEDEKVWKEYEKEAKQLVNNIII